MDTKDLLPPILQNDQEWDPQFEAAAELEALARHLDLEDWILNRIRHCERETVLNLPLVRDDGTPVNFTGYRVQHLTSRGPTMGGVSFIPATHLGTVRANAMQSTWQAALLNLPFGGASGAIVCTPEELSERELRLLARDYVHGLHPVLGCQADVLTPGIGCNEHTMVWMLNSYARNQHGLELGVVTGKPANMWGLPGSMDPGVKGVFEILEHVFAEHQTDIRGKRISIQGFGALGASLADEFYRRGARVICVADISGGLQNSSGIDVPALRRHADTTGVIFGFPDADQACNADVLEAECDVLVTAAAEHQINAQNADRIKARVIVEATPWSVAGTAQDLLAVRGITVIPEILATAGSAIGSFLEWRQCVRLATVSSAEVDQEVSMRVDSVWRSIAEIKRKHQMPTPRAAHFIALNQVASELRIQS